MQHNYDLALEKYLIRNFILENDRSPNETEIVQLKKQGAKDFPRINEVGFSGILITKPQFSSESSSEVENTNREAIYSDILLADERVEELSSKLENIFRSLYATSKNIQKRLNSIESRVDNVLLLSGSTDAFVSGVEENFATQELIDFNQTTASVESGFCTMGRAGFGFVDLNDAVIKHSTISDKGYIAIQNTSPIDNLKNEDGSFWEHLVYTNYSTGRVTLVIDIVLNEPSYVSELRITGNTNSVNSNTTATIFYSLDDKSFKSTDIPERVLVNEESIFNVGQDNVQTIRIMLSKDRYDNTTNLNNQYVYLFSLDSIKVYSDGYAGDGDSELYAGPYDIVDYEGKEVNFTKATCEVCMSSGEDTAVSAYLSVDGDTYLPVSLSDEGLRIVSFENSSDTGTEVLLDDTYSSNSLLVLPIAYLEAKDVLINKSISVDYKDNYIRKSIVVKRNVPYILDGIRPKIYGSISGWNYIPEKKSYSTTVYVSNPEGLGIDLGATSAYINNIQVSGLVKLLPGYSVFETNESNWNPIDSAITSLQTLQKLDSLYPYNHKYLIEGYVYSDSFIGERIYNGVEEYFGSLLTYVTPEIFSLPENDSNLNIYTLDDTENIMFKVKANKQDSTWLAEKINVSWSISRGNFNKLWLKLILHSSNESISPIVSSVQMRVV